MAQPLSLRTQPNALQRSDCAVCIWPGFSGVFERFKMNKIATRLGALSLVSLASLPAFAAVDVTAATTGVGDAQTAVLAVLAVMITMAAAVFGVKKVLRLLGR